MSYYSGIKAVLWDLIDPIEALLVLNFIIINTGYKNYTKKGTLGKITCALGWLIMVLLNEKYIPFVPVAIILCNFLFGIYAAFYLKCGVLQYTFWYVMGIVSMTLFDAMAFLILIVIVNTDNSYAYIMENFPIRMSGAIISKLLFFIFINAYKRIKNGEWESENKEITPEIVISVAFAAVFVILFVYNLMGISQNEGAVIQLNLYIVIIIMVVLIGGLLIRNKREKETLRKKLELILGENELINAHYMGDVSLYEKMRENRHDAKHHKEYLKYLEKEQKYDEMILYLRQIISGGIGNEQ